MSKNPLGGLKLIHVLSHFKYMAGKFETRNVG